MAVDCHSQQRTTRFGNAGRGLANRVRIRDKSGSRLSNRFRRSMVQYGVPARLTDPIRGSSEPDRMWTLTNVGEATPDILSPLCWSLWGNGGEFASRAGLYDFRGRRRSALSVPDDPNKWATACFY